MAKFEVINELTLRIIFDNTERVHTKAGAMIGFQGSLKFDKELLGPNNNRGLAGAALGHISRRLSGENLPLMLITPQTRSIGYFADQSQHIIVIDLQPNERISVESENLLAFSESCTYGIRFLGVGILSQKGLMTSTITGPGQVAITTNGNPIVLNGPCCVDPDAFVSYAGNETPQLKLQVSWKNLIGQASGESYFFHFNNPNTKVIIQPNERKSGIDIGIDGVNGQATRQNNSLFRDDGNQVIEQIGQAFSERPNRTTPNEGTSGMLGDFLNNMLR